MYSFLNTVQLQITSAEDLFLLGGLGLESKPRVLQSGVHWYFTSKHMSQSVVMSFNSL